MTTTTEVIRTIPARFERATPGFGGRDTGFSACSAPEHLFTPRPDFAGFGVASDLALSAEYRRLARGLAQTRHSTARA